MPHVFTDLFYIKMLHASVPRTMKKYDNEHDFRRGHRAGAMILALFIGSFNCIPVDTSIKKIAELVCHKKDFRSSPRTK